VGLGGEMSNGILNKEFDTASFFTILFGLSGWAILMITTFYIFIWFFTPPQFCGYYLDHSRSYYDIKTYWKFGVDTTVYSTFNGKEAIEVLKQLNEQVSPLIQQQRKDI
jgi:hypothetical protein